MPRSNPIDGVSKSKLAGLTSSLEYRMNRRALVRKYVHKKPSVVERALLDTAALFQTRAQLAALDPTISEDGMVKIIAASRRALEHLQAIASERPLRNGRLPTFADGMRP
jgi:hypothetical protein